MVARRLVVLNLGLSEIELGDRGSNPKILEIDD